MQFYGKINPTEIDEIMLKQRFDDKVHLVEVMKWGVFDGALVGGFVALLTIVHAKRGEIIALLGASSLEFAGSLFLVLLITLGAIITTTITFAHPIYSIIQRDFKDAALTLFVSILTILSMAGFAIWSTPYLN